jgi:hypothetical protein
MINKKDIMRSWNMRETNMLKSKYFVVCKSIRLFLIEVKALDNLKTLSVSVHSLQSDAYQNMNIL